MTMALSPSSRSIVLPGPVKLLAKRVVMRFLPLQLLGAACGALKQALLVSCDLAHETRNRIGRYGTGIGAECAQKKLIRQIGPKTLYQFDPLQEI